MSIDGWERGGNGGRFTNGAKVNGDTLGDNIGTTGDKGIKDAVEVVDIDVTILGDTVIFEGVAWRTGGDEMTLWPSFCSDELLEPGLTVFSLAEFSKLNL